MVEEMSWIEKKEDGTVEKYKIGYSQELQFKQLKETQWSNVLKFVLIGMLAVFIICLLLIGVNTGLIGMYLKKMVCV